MSLNNGGDPPNLSPNTMGRQVDVSDPGKSDALTRLLVDETAHDLRSLVCNFKTCMYLAQQQPAQSDKHLAALDQLVDHLDALVSRLSSVSRSGMEDLPDEPRLLNLNDVVARIVGAYQPLAQCKGIALASQVAPSL